MHAESPALLLFACTPVGQGSEDQVVNSPKLPPRGYETWQNEITNPGITSPAESTPSRPAVGRRRHARSGPVRCGLPCANCRLYYAAELPVCPICRCGDRISPTARLVPPTALL